MKLDKILILHPTCFPVKGAKRSVILDLQRQELSFIPNDLYYLLNNCNKKRLREIYSAYSESEKETVEEYIEFLISNEFAFLGSQHDANLIDELDLQWDYFGRVSNGIFEFATHSEEYFELFCEQLNKLGCSAIQIISYDFEITINRLEKILNHLQVLSFIDHIELVLPYSTLYSQEFFDSFFVRYFKINSVIIHSSPYNLGGQESLIVFVSEPISSNHLCGQVSIKDFAFNVTHVSESMKHNTCLNRKISVDKNGNIKNCPSMLPSFGHISNTPLKDVISKGAFKDIWNVNKDQIEVCKDCEFRHICTDCRAHTENPNNLYSKPAKCKYDPYSATWL
jgi:SPASM domain peptide maturase of grasp-with-spasm system